MRLIKNSKKQVIKLLVGMLSMFSVAASPAAESPNIIFFLVDDMGILDCSEPFLRDEQGKWMMTELNKRYRTPNIQKLAAQGMKFTNAYAYSVCTPTRSAIMTGQSAVRQGITTWTHPQKSIDTDHGILDGVMPASWTMSGVDLNQPLMPKILKNGGYRTIHCGKAHFGPEDTEASKPESLGFDVNIAGYGGGGPGSYLGKDHFSAAHRGSGHEWDVPGLEKYHDKDIYLTEALTLEIKEEIAKSVQAKEPFFAYMAHYAVHAPFQVDTRFAANYPQLKGNDLAFATQVEGMDKSLGDLMIKLEDLGVAEDTLIIFYSDNGSDGPKNLPLRGKKGTRFEGGTRVPLIMAWAKANPENALQKALPIAANSVNSSLVQPMDLYVSVLELAKQPVDKENLDGVSILPALKGNPETLMTRSFLNHFPHRRGEDAYFSTYQNLEWKISYSYTKKSWHLTNLKADPYEQENILKQQPEKAKEMAKLLKEELHRHRAKMPRSQATGKELALDFSEIEKL